jgi:hypothetical protein
VSRGPGLTPIVPEVLAVSPTMMSGFMGGASTHFETFAELVAIFERRQDSIRDRGDPSKDLKVLCYEAAMIAGEWRGAIVFRRDSEGLICDGIHRGIAYLRCVDAGAELRKLPELLLAPPGSYRWPDGLKEQVEADQR